MEVKILVLNLKNIMFVLNFIYEFDLIYYRYKMIDDYHFKKWRNNIVFEKKNYTI